MVTRRGLLAASIGALVWCVLAAAPASALVPAPDPVTLSRLTTGVAEGAEIAGEATNPVGWAILAGTALWWGYQHKDSIVDFFNGPNTPQTLAGWCGLSSCGGGYFPTNQDSFIRVRLTGATGGSLNGTVECVNVRMYTIPTPPQAYCGNSIGFDPQFTSAGPSAQALGQKACKDPTTGAVVVSTFSTGISWSVPRAGGVATRSASLCASPNSLLVGVRVAPFSSNAGETGTWHQHMAVGWGTLADADANDVVTFDTATTTAHCKNAKTGETLDVAMSSPWGSGADHPTVVLPSCKEHLGDDWYGAGLTIAPTAPEIDNEPLPDEVPWTVPDFLPWEWDEELPADGSPEDQPCEGTSDGCRFSIWIDGQVVRTGVGVATEVQTIYDTDPTRFECHYGQRIVDDKYCVPIISSLDSGTSTLGGTGTDSGTETTPGQSTGNQTVPEEAKGCMSAIWSLNPVDWVFVPVKCAIEWAFVPKTSINMDELPIGGWVAMPSFTDACPVFSFSMAGHPLTLDICSGAVASIKDTTRPLIDGALGLFTVLGGYRRVAAMFGAGDDEA